MPYKHAHYGIAFVLLVILIGFWASYFAVAGTGPLAFHIHALASIAWLLVILLQHITIHRRANAFHRQMGKASIWFFPLLMLGFVMIINVSAQRFAEAENPHAIQVTPAFGIGMIVAMAAYFTLFYQALRNRRNVKLHAGYMLATPLILFESPFSRIMGQYLPWMNVIGSDGPHALIDTIVIGNALAAAFAAWLYLRHREHGAPWLLVIFFTTLQSVAMWFAPTAPFVGQIFGIYARIPDFVTMALGVGIGILAGWLGWRAGLSPARKGRTAPQAA